MTGQQIKRLLALLRATAEGKVNHFDVPVGFKESFESQVDFRGWVNYHVTWDVDPDDLWKVVALEKSLEQQWHDDLEKVVPVITPEGEIVTAEEWAQRSASTK